MCIRDRCRKLCNSKNLSCDITLPKPPGDRERVDQYSVTQYLQSSPISICRATKLFNSSGVVGFHLWNLEVGGSVFTESKNCWACRFVSVDIRVKTESGKNFPVVKSVNSAEIYCRLFVVISSDTLSRLKVFE